LIQKKDTMAKEVEISDTDYVNDPTGELQDATSAAEEYFASEDYEDDESESGESESSEDNDEDLDDERSAHDELVEKNRDDDDEDDEPEEEVQKENALNSGRKERLVAKAIKLDRENARMSRELVALKTRIQELESNKHPETENYPDEIEAVRHRIAKRLKVQPDDKKVEAELSEMATMLLYMTAGEELPQEYRGRVESRKAKLEAAARDKQVQDKLDMLERREREAAEANELNKIHNGISGILNSFDPSDATFLRTGAVGNPAELIAKIIKEETDNGLYQVTQKNVHSVVKDVAYRLDKYYRNQASRYAEALQKAGNSGSPMKQQKASEKQVVKQGHVKQDAKDKSGKLQNSKQSKVQDEDESFIDFIEREEREEKVRLRRR